ncbi:sensor histidine kinase [Corynebacterium simulans]|uniref:sensor histidine kinase n=1 Tax=Corynebacterium simulans TaxID=146827 RepID=UPI002002FF82|nr:sensor histidine kinase [Corynebacterium simulans]MCK6161754.1 sensor histidine kinase [Corynebacterium simulans]
MMSIIDQRSSETEALRNGIHILTATLLVVAIFSTVRLPLWQAVINLLLLTAFAAIYFAGSVFLEQWPKGVRYLWLVILSVVWMADMFVAPVAIYLVFALFFLYLYVLDLYVGIVCVIAATAISVIIQIPGGLTFGGVMGPAVSALVTVAIYYAFRALSLMNRELIETRSQLAESERESGMIAERQRIAHEIHDTLAQGLSSIQMLLHAADRDLGKEDIQRAQERIELARRTAADNLHEARAMIAALQPPALAETSLEAALNRMAENFAATSSVNVEVEAEGEELKLPMKVEAALLRIAQGAVGNVVKHAGATRARITVTYAPDEVRVDVVDNGHGFDVAKVQDQPAGLGHIGLSAMSRRAEELGGEVVVESTPGSGTAVSVSMPLGGTVD